ncbi:hypothetical protein VOLCADRAFT_85804 [Volvox carteri f. nagariensis]|uniref:Uncharacterized protein n=1 Tax=Volvox carteri f. nagariensis TaxID=3068 RepID=D8TH14_VOLCA|nr:uncharacterized protein VOLCADRAFT_85804 [Volvox carteri f. nagariensis]EFJ52631.1 hypothetical protein VOLCADRAFT_85804 [Volvox carteri f. nagariensis]|eukprot:XP_002945636.1 hypothetical protein VOLCADRAFT_85804 [Volvox carteri f. nagariensis]
MPQSFTMLQPEGETIVEVKRSTGGKADDTTLQLSARAAIVDEHLDSCIGALESSTSTVSCFGRKYSSVETAQKIAVLERERQNLRRILHDIVDLARTHSSEAEALRSRLTEAEKALLAARLPPSGDLVSDLQRQIQDLTSEYQGITEKAELELRRLESELGRVEAAREAALAESQEKSREIRSFQKRYDTLKSIAESHREAVMVAKKQADEPPVNPISICEHHRAFDPSYLRYPRFPQTAASHAKAMEAQTRRIAEARAGREAALAELETLRREHAALHDAFVRAGGVDHQISMVRKSFLTRSNAGSCSSGGGSGGRVRNLLKGRHGWCVHARPCGGGGAGGAGGDTTKLTPLSYDSQAALESLIKGGELFLCPTCLANGSFRTL